ncbi:hypothetical protein Slin_6671 (plasmid) [Spirosoma linguale DSM 74]|uniref:Uncharacterized protein n=1 Tax=Spirosoma linguale (strain ATCC 33905 / DSM 74 / LMG 10896 / Claus 1) TaxID=504472 RepID=D2QUZ6_SPILD|nr:hypothetical protein Slin_6671 [Spirosoma linguale DSM 74]
MNCTQQRHRSKKIHKIYKKKIRRRRKLVRLRNRYLNLKHHAHRTGKIDQTLSSFHAFTASVRAGNRPSHSQTIQFLSKIVTVFANQSKFDLDKGHFQVPKVFSLTDNYQETFTFLKRLFVVLHARHSIEITIDYAYCERIDLDASVVLDVLLREFIINIHSCRQKGHRTTHTVRPINFNRPEIEEILLSIGSYRILKGLFVDFPNSISFPLRTGGKYYPGQVEINSTDVVAYIEQCLNRCDRELTGPTKKELSDIIGEVLNNADVHSTIQQHYLIGYFKLNQDQAKTVGTFNLVIFNFGDTIYQKFKDPACPNQTVVSQMKELSKMYTERGWLTQLLDGPRFEEETLWTLYALQQGVTSYKNWERGNGTIEFIESFFVLKGDNEQADDSQLTLLSGNTRITFDGTYGIKTRTGTGPDNQNEYVKVMTFNESGDIRQQPDRNFVNFTPHFFPGTLISAKICIKPSNTAVKINAHESATD